MIQKTQGQFAREREFEDVDKYWAQERRKAQYAKCVIEIILQTHEYEKKSAEEKNIQGGESRGKNNKQKRGAKQKSKGLKMQTCKMCGAEIIKSGHYLSCTTTAHDEGMAAVRSFIVGKKRGVEEWDVEECKECKKYVKQQQETTASMGRNTIRKVKLKDLRDRYTREKEGRAMHTE